MNNAQKKYLKQLAHHLKPIVWAGQHGITDSLTNEILQALNDHELIKIKLRLGEREERDAGIDAICTASGAEFIQRVGNILTLYKPHPDKPKIKLP